MKLPTKIIGMVFCGSLVASCDVLLPTQEEIDVLNSWLDPWESIGEQYNEIVTSVCNGGGGFGITSCN